MPFSIGIHWHTAQGLHTPIAGMSIALSINWKNISLNCNLSWKVSHLDIVRLPSNDRHFMHTGGLHNDKRTHAIRRGRNSRLPALDDLWRAAYIEDIGYAIKDGWRLWWMERRWVPFIRCLGYGDGPDTSYHRLDDVIPSISGIGFAFDHSLQVLVFASWHCTAHHSAPYHCTFIETHIWMDGYQHPWATWTIPCTITACWIRVTEKFDDLYPVYYHTKKWHHANMSLFHGQHQSAHYIFSHPGVEGLYNEPGFFESIRQRHASTWCGFQRSWHPPTWWRWFTCGGFPWIPRGSHSFKKEYHVGNLSQYHCTKHTPCSSMPYENWDVWTFLQLYTNAMVPEPFTILFGSLWDGYQVLIALRIMDDGSMLSYTLYGLGGLWNSGNVIVTGDLHDAYAIVLTSHRYRHLERNICYRRTDHHSRCMLLQSYPGLQILY